MPLSFDERQLLPEGIHDANLDDIRRVLSLTSRRQVLFENLKQYIESVRLTGWACEVLVDGSFAMPAVGMPNDIDIILVLPTNWDMNRRDFKLFEYNVLDGRHAKRSYKIEVFPVLPNSDRLVYFTTLFSQVRVEHCRELNLPVESRKGLIRVVP